MNDVWKRAPGERVAIVVGCRTPFARAGGALALESSLDLARTVVSELLHRAELPSTDVDRVILGTVVPNVEAPNLAREVALAAGLPRSTEGYTVSRACASANQAIANAYDAVASGDAVTVIAGGSESLSNVPILASKKLARALVGASKARSWRRKLAAFEGIKVKDLFPVTPAIAEHSTGLTMGASAEKMAQQNGISREEQDRYALRSHRLAAAATDDGRLPSEMVRYFVKPAFTRSLLEDEGIRRDTDLAALSALRPVFDRKYGTLTAGNSSPLTDGAAALLIMREDKAKADGREALGYIRSYAFVGVDPFDQLLIGPAYSTPLALDRAGLTLSDMTLVDLHEAFAAQVLSVLKALESESFCREKLNRAPLGSVPDEKLNVMGGSIAIGHPFGATGARITLSVLNELRRRGGGFGLVSVCAAGGLGASMVLEAP
jgi:acetyl-CoA acyltransferase